MAGTQITQTRLPVVIDNGTKFQISATCTLAGTLPSTHIFVRQVIRIDDPKDDTFVRIADVTDFTNFGTSRDACILNRSFIYRTNTFIQNYDTVTEANDAWKEFSSRINALVETYDTYIGEFLTSTDGAVVTYPAVDESTKTSLINAYNTAADAVADLEDERDEHNAECKAKLTELAQLQLKLTETAADVAALTPIVASLGVSIPVLDGAHATLNGTQSSAYASANLLTNSAEKTNILTQLTTIGLQAGVINTEISSLETDVQTPLANLLGTLQTRHATLTSSVNALQLEVNQCYLEVAARQAAVDTARAQRDAALAAVRAVCPDYVPES